MIAPLTSQSLGLQKAQVTNGIREVIIHHEDTFKILFFLILGNSMQRQR